MVQSIKEYMMIKDLRMGDHVAGVTIGLGEAWQIGKRKMLLHLKLNITTNTRIFE